MEDRTNVGYTLKQNKKPLQWDSRAVEECYNEKPVIAIGIA